MNLLQVSIRTSENSIPIPTRASEIIFEPVLESTTVDKNVTIPNVSDPTIPTVSDSSTLIPNSQPKERKRRGKAHLDETSIITSGKRQRLNKKYSK